MNRATTTPMKDEAPTSPHSWTFERRKDGGVILALVMVVLACKIPTLDTPFFWDECSWGRFAYELHDAGAWTAVAGLHEPTTYAGHPPALHGLTAILFHILEPSRGLAHLVAASFGALGVAFTYLLGCLLGGRLVGVFAAVFLFANSLYFTQAGFFLADLPLAALSVMAAFFALRGNYPLYLLSGLWLVATKETGMAIPFALSVYFFLTDPERTGGTRPTLAVLRRALRWSVPLFVIVAYYIWQKMVTGQFFFIYPEEPAFFQGKASSVAHRLGIVSGWLFLYQFRWVLSVFILLQLVRGRAFRSANSLMLLSIMALCSAFPFGFFFFLPRYILPVAPFFFIVGAWALVETFRSGRLRLLAAAGVLGLSMLPHFGACGPDVAETDMRYLSATRCVVEMAAVIEAQADEHSRILTEWPLTSHLLRPREGYVAQALNLVRFPMRGPVPAADLVVVSIQPHLPHRLLQAHVAQRQLREIHRVVVGPSECRLYAGSPAPSGQ